MKLFRFQGIALELHPTFYLLPLIVAGQGWLDEGWAGAVASLWALALVYICVVLHEFGHALTARRLGLPVHHIVLLPIGGMALLGRMPRKPLVELLIVAAGPMVNFLIAGICLVLLGGWPADWQAVGLPGAHPANILKFLLVVNVTLGCFNLLPAFPMDGGRVLRAVLALRGNYLRATRQALVIGRVVAGLGIVFALWNGFYMLAVLFGFILVVGGWEYQQLVRDETPPLL